MFDKLHVHKMLESLIKTTLETEQYMSITSSQAFLHEYCLAPLVQWANPKTVQMAKLSW